MSTSLTLFHKICLICLLVLCVVSIAVFQLDLGYITRVTTDTALFRELSVRETWQFGSEPYAFQNNSTIVTGQRFPVLGCTQNTPDYFVNISNYDLSNFTIITGSSWNHFKESRDLIAGIQKVFPDKKVYYYDLGLMGYQVTQLKTWCNVVYRKWDFSLYPRHVHNLRSYAFKPLIIHEALHEFEAIFWMDSSGRLARKQNKTHWDSVYATARRTEGVVQFDITGRDIFQCTHGAMYRYLPANEEKLKTFQMVGANLILLYRTEAIYTKLIHWFRLCALTSACIIPEGHKIGCGATVSPGVSICHRYDQSALNILIANMHNYSDIRVPKVGKVVEVHRKVTKFFSLKTDCVVRS